MAVSNDELDIVVDLLNGIFDDDPVEEDEAWGLFAKMFIEGPIPPYVRVMIANVSDPAMRKTFKRRLAFKRERGRGKSINDRRVASVVWHRIKAGDKNAYAKWKDEFEKFSSKVKGLTRTSE
jgi:hypothetical protein